MQWCEHGNSIPCVCARVSLCIAVRQSLPRTGTALLQVLVVLLLQARPSVAPSTLISWTRWFQAGGRRGALRNLVSALDARLTAVRLM